MIQDSGTDQTAAIEQIGFRLAKSKTIFTSNGIPGENREHGIREGLKHGMGREWWSVAMQAQLEG